MNKNIFIDFDVPKYAHFMDKADGISIGRP